MRWSRLLFLMTLAAGCGSSSYEDLPAAPAVTLEARSGEAFRLRPGQTARLPGAGLFVFFRGITEDSRCPRAVVCVWAGNAGARIRVSADGDRYTTYDLHTTLEPKAVRFAGRTIALVAVEPVPESGSTIDPDDYVITLRVD